MRKLLLSLCVLLLITSAFKKKDIPHQSSAYQEIHDTIPATVVGEDTSTIFTEVDEEPKFIGDVKAWQMFLMKNLNAEVPVKKRAPNGAYKVIIQFLVEKDGTTKDFSPLTKFGYGMEEECLRVLKISGKWQPAMRDGQPVRYFRKQPITILVSDN